MKKYIAQHCTVQQQFLFDISRPFNETYAKKLGYEYVTDSVRRCPERSIYWEKIAYLRVLLPTLPDDSLVVWEDADSINVKLDSFEQALPKDGILGMVQNRTGLGRLQLMDWYNAGVIVMINNAMVRDFFERVWIRPNETDEAAIVYELKHDGWMVGNGVYVSSIASKWNRWRNNEHFTKDTVVQSWHGIRPENKLTEMKKFVAEMPKSFLG